MKPSPRPSSLPGVSLLEGIIAVGVLAVAIPLVFGALTESGTSGEAAKAETRCAWMVPACIEEIQASRAGQSQYFPATAAGEAFPEAGALWALGFTTEGEAIGRLSSAEYQTGVTMQPQSQLPAYIATLSAEPIVPTESPPMLRCRIIIEFPAAAPAAKRQKLVFFTRIS